MNINKEMIELEKATKVHELSTLKVKVNVTIYEQIVQVSLSLSNLAKDLSKAVNGPPNTLGPANIQDAANFFLKRMADEFQPEIKLCCSEIVVASSSLEDTIQSICISHMHLRKTGRQAECNCMPPSYHPSLMQAFLALSIGFAGGKVDINRPGRACKCNDKVKCMLQIPLALRALLDKHRTHLQRVKLSAETAKTFATLLIPNVLPRITKGVSTSPEHVSSTTCVKSFEDALNALQQICGEYK